MNIERRFKARYPIELNVRYHTFGKSVITSGEGRTVNFSSSGVLVATSDKVADGSRLRLTIEWPSLLNGTTPLQLVTFGRVVRTDEAGFAVALEHYQFRTMKRRTDLTLAPAASAALPAIAQRTMAAAASEHVREAVSMAAKSRS